MAALPQLITVEQFRELPDDGRLYELHAGEVVAMTRPKHRHIHLQRRIAELFGPKLKLFGVVIVELPYRPLPEFELWAADVAAISQARYDSTDPDDNLHGTPEFVVEIKSRSNRKRRLRERASFCLNKDTLEFWIVDSDKKSVTVMRSDGIPRVFATGESLSLAAFRSGDLPVDEIFA